MSSMDDMQTIAETPLSQRGSVTELRERAEMALDALSIGTNDVGTDILDQRARELARPPAASIETSELTDVVVFQIGTGTYAIETTNTYHVVRMSNLAAIPGCDPNVMGVCLYGGEIIPVFDISELLGEIGDGPSTHGWAVLLGAGEIEVAILVDRVDSLKTIRTNQLETLSRAALISEAGKFIEGTLPDGLTFIDAARLLAHESMRIAR